MKTYLALLWHQHQPYYYDPALREFAMPWVRLHGIKDYFGMAALAEEFPAIRLNINFVPSLLRQLEMYVSGELEDRELKISRKNADSLSADDRKFMLENFFRAQVERMILPYSRYNELYEKARALGRRGMTAVVRKMSDQDYLDLQVWATLAWFHPIRVEQDEALRELRHKGTAFTENDKELLFAKQRETLAAIIPMHRKLQEENRIEVTTTPYYHPILPLLCKMESAREAMPGVKLPEELSSLRADAEEQVRRSVEAYRGWFGILPRGVWPAEGSVSPETLECFRQNGFEWFASDEEVLAATLKQPLQRDQYGKVFPPEWLYKPYRVQIGSDGLNGIFRDKRLSDLIGFHYKDRDQLAAANDLVAQIAAIGRTCRNKPTLVSVILDGENAWEHYPDNGIVFLRHLYRLLSDSKEIETVRVSDFLRAYPPTDTLPTIFSGSWINNNFAIWVGHEEDNRAWNYVARAREALVKAAPDAERRLGAAAVANAWEELYAAEGSDWYWWFGDDHSSPLDATFDALFRKHLQNVYRFLGLEIPSHLHEPIKRLRRQEKASAPWEKLKVTLDGRKTHYFEWVGAGHLKVMRQRGTMDHTAKCLVTDVYFGFGEKHLYLRIDTTGSIRTTIGERDVISIVFQKPEPMVICITDITAGGKGTLKAADREILMKGLLAVDDILEVALPLEIFKSFGPGTEVAFFVERLCADGTIERVPEYASLSFNVPRHDFETIEWYA